MDSSSKVTLNAIVTLDGSGHLKLKGDPSNSSSGSIT